MVRWCSDFCSVSCIPDCIWIVMGLTFFPAIGKGLFAADAGLGLKPTIFSLLMVLTYSITLSAVYSVLRLRKQTSAS
jgi:hypothetical protein